VQINGHNKTENVDTIIADLKALGTGFRERTEYTGHYFGRGESEKLRAVLEQLIDNDIRSGKPNPMSLNLRPIVAEAHRVEGGEVGFSDKEPIGTDNTHDCVTVMLRDPITKKTALAHIGGDTTEESLQTLWEGMTQSGATIEMRLLGGRQLPIDVPENDPAYSYKKKNNDIARWNVEKVVRFFKDKPVNVLSADILTPDQPAVVVVDPKTFAITEKVPGKHNPNAYVNGLMVLYTGNFLEEGPSGHNPLMAAFDLTKSPERNPVQLTATQLAQLHRFAAMDHGQIETHFKTQGRSGLMLDQSVERTEMLCDAYRESIQSQEGHSSGVQWSRLPRNLESRRSAGMTRQPPP